MNRSERLAVHRRAAELEGMLKARLEPALTSPDEPHVHNFHTGSARCTLCKRTVAEAHVDSGGMIVGPKATTDDGWRAPTHAVGVTPLQAEQAPALTRMDVVAHAWGLVRRPGEDEHSLATRVRREAARHAGVVKTPPPMGWAPPAGFRLGDDWRKAFREQVNAMPVRTLLDDGAVLETDMRPTRDRPMKRVNG